MAKCLMVVKQHCMRREDINKTTIWRTRKNNNFIQSSGQASYLKIYTINMYLVAVHMHFVQQRSASQKTKEIASKFA